MFDALKCLVGYAIAHNVAAVCTKSACNSDVEKVLEYGNSVKIMQEFDVSYPFPFEKGPKGTRLLGSYES
jgi:hypothetical protein